MMNATIMEEVSNGLGYGICHNRNKFSFVSMGTKISKLRFVDGTTKFSKK